METPTVPNTARILDYWLGGNHHFPVDVEGAKLFESVYDDFPTVFRTLRDYIGRSARYIASQGIDQFIVFGAGLPTCDNVHEAVPNAKVLYTDIDEANIKLGQEILADNPNADYAFCDASDLSTLDPEVVARVLGPLKRVGLVFVGVAAFIPDEVLKGMFEELYNWAPAGSYLELDFDGEALVSYPKALEFLAGMGTPLTPRNPSTIAPLLGKWVPTEHGIVPVNLLEGERAVGQDYDPSKVFMYGTVVQKLAE
jgi:hypothetical protein